MFQVLVPGEGEPPEPGQVVVVRYSAWLDSEDTPFASSDADGGPTRFLLGARRVIQGWEEAVSSMRPGEKRRLVVPASLAYGGAGVVGVVPPDATVIYELELVGGDVEPQ